MCDNLAKAFDGEYDVSSSITLLLSRDLRPFALSKPLLAASWMFCMVLTKMQQYIWQVHITGATHLVRDGVDLLGATL